LKDLRAKNKAEEGQLREKNNRGEDFLKEIITGYDEMMEAKEKEILDLETEVQKIEKEIKDYQESLTMLKNEEAKEREIEKKIAEKREVTIFKIFFRNLFFFLSTMKLNMTKSIPLFKLSKMLGNSTKVTN